MEKSHDLEVIRSETAFLSLLFALFACAASLVQDPRLNPSGRQDDGGMGMVYYERYVPNHYYIRVKALNIIYFHRKAPLFYNISATPILSSLTSNVLF